MFGPTMRIIFLLLAGVCFIAVGCGTTATSELVGDVGVATDALPDTTTGDSGATDSSAAQDAVTIDTAPPEPAPPRPAPPLPTPERSQTTANLYCNLDNGQIVQGALRGGDCLGLSVAGILDDMARGPFFGEPLLSGYAKSTFGSCELVRCLNDATNCDEAGRCNREHELGPCETAAGNSRCEGSTVQNCLWNGESYRWYAVTDCARLGATCEQSDCPNGFCTSSATCVGPQIARQCDYYGRCEGDQIVRCMAAQQETMMSLEVRVDCGEVIPNGTCIETPIGGEVPGPTCAAPEPDCVNAFGGLECLDATTLSVCLFGRKTTVDCAEYGYQRCQSGDWSFETRCVR